MIKRLLITAFFLFGSLAHAGTGGTCPSTANLDGGLYAAPSSCVYADFVGGSDSNDGLSEASGHPWKHFPGMPNCSGNCATFSLAAGNGMILKGGVTWDYTNWPWAPGVSGTSGGNDAYGGCTGVHCIYIGVDRTWGTGRPIISGGDWSNPGTNTTCYYDMDKSDGSQIKIIKLDSQTNWIVDDLEFTGACLQEPSMPPGGNNPAYINNGGGGHTTYENNYAHRVAYPGTSNNAASFDAFGGNGDHVTYNVIDFTDSGPTTTFTSGGPGFYCCAGIAGANTYEDHDVIVAAGAAEDEISPISRHDNYYLNDEVVVYGTGFHEHFSNDGTCASGSTITMYNNVADTAPGAAQGWGFTTAGGPCTYYIFNNIDTNVSVDGGHWYMGGSSGNGTSATFIWFNNTMECGPDAGPPANRCSFSNGATFDLFNDHFITGIATGGYFTCDQSGDVHTCLSWNTSAGTTANANFNTVPGAPIGDLVQQTKSTANGQGYAYTQTYQFSPTTSMGATVGVGVNKTAYCTAIASSNAATALADAAACQNDTSYAVTYNQINHTAVNSGRTTVARPTSGAWDAGAYQYSAGAPSCNAPTASPTLGIPPQTVTLSSSTGGCNIFYSTSGTATCSSTTYSGPISVTINPTTISAVTCQAGYTTGGPASWTYSGSINPTPAPAVTLFGMSYPGDWQRFGPNGYDIPLAPQSCLLTLQ